MARPKKELFFEVDLPHVLPETEEWLYTFYYNSKMVVEYMLENGAQTTAYHTAINCLSGLRTYLLRSDLPYSPENAIHWFNDTGPYPKGYRAVLFRLEDLYLYGIIQPVNAFPQALSYEKKLVEPWKRILTEFRETLALSVRSEIQVKNCISRFLYRIQESGITSASQITFEVLENYFQTEGHRSEKTYSRYTYAVGDILLFMADKGMCHHGLGWYPYFRMHDRVFHLNDFTASQIELLEKTKAESLVFPAEKYAMLTADFLKAFMAFGYSKAPCKIAHYTLHNLLLFLEMHGYGYHKTVASIWLEHEKLFHKGDAWKMARRVLHLFDVYVERGAIIPEMIFREKPLLYERLPLWCREESDKYLEQKVKEGWDRSTLDMIRSSITRFCAFLTELGFENFSEITPETLKNFNIYDPHNSAEAKNAYNGRIRKFLRYLERKSVIPYGLHHALQATAADKGKIVVVLTGDEKKAIKAKQDNCISPMDLRDKAMLMIGTKMGLRASDIVAIRLADIDWKRQTLHLIQKKTDHEILLPIPTDVANAIYLYISKGRPNEKSSSEYLFVKNRVPYNSLDRNVCCDALKRTLPDRNVPGSGFHVTRKTYATERLRNGTGKQGLADLLGHKDTQSLNHYLLLDEEKMRMCPLSLAETGLPLKGGRYDNA